MLRSSTAPRVAAAPVLRMQKGFGTPPPAKKVGEIAADRKRAAGKYEELKQSGSPEFNVFFRKVGATDEDGAVKGGWYPVGSLACPSSQEIGRAIFSTEDAFLQGAYRIHGKQIKKEFKGFEDEDVKVAEKPREPSQLEGFLGKISQAV